MRVKIGSENNFGSQSQKTCSLPQYMSSKFLLPISHATFIIWIWAAQTSATLWPQFQAMFYLKLTIKQYLLHKCWLWCSRTWGCFVFIMLWSTILYLYNEKTQNGISKKPQNDNKDPPAISRKVMKANMLQNNSIFNKEAS